MTINRDFYRTTLRAMRAAYRAAKAAETHGDDDEAAWQAAFLRGFPPGTLIADIEAACARHDAHVDRVHGRRVKAHRTHKRIHRQIVNLFDGMPADGISTERAAQIKAAHGDPFAQFLLASGLLEDFDPADPAAIAPFIDRVAREWRET